MLVSLDLWNMFTSNPVKKKKPENGVILNTNLDVDIFLLSLLSQTKLGRRIVTLIGNLGTLTTSLTLAAKDLSANLATNLATLSVV
jgi:hypothetical protein